MAHPFGERTNGFKRADRWTVLGAGMFAGRRTSRHSAWSVAFFHRKQANLLEPYVEECP